MPKRWVAYTVILFKIIEALSKTFINISSLTIERLLLQKINATRHHHDYHSKLAMTGLRRANYFERWWRAWFTWRLLDWADILVPPCASYYERVLPPLFRAVISFYAIFKISPCPPWCRYITLPDVSPYFFLIVFAFKVDSATFVISSFLPILSSLKYAFELYQLIHAIILRPSITHFIASSFHLLLFLCDYYEGFSIGCSKKFCQESASPLPLYAIFYFRRDGRFTVLLAFCLSYSMLPDIHFKTVNSRLWFHAVNENAFQPQTQYCHH